VANEDKDAFLLALETAIEAKTAELVAEATGTNAVLAVRVARFDEKEVAQPAS